MYLHTIQGRTLVEKVKQKEKSSTPANIYMTNSIVMKNGREERAYVLIGF
jgi:hypothetical protein